jgi:hypothetical protein
MMAMTGNAMTASTATVMRNSNIDVAPRSILGAGGGRRKVIFAGRGRAAGSSSSVQPKPGAVTGGKQIFIRQRVS